MKKFATIVALASTMVLAQQENPEAGTLNKSNSDVKENTTATSGTCDITKIIGCRLGKTLCGIKIDFKQSRCSKVVASTEACKDNTVVEACHAHAFQDGEFLVSLATPKGGEVGLQITTNKQVHPIGDFDATNMNASVDVGQNKRLIGIRYDSSKKLVPAQQAFSWMKFLISTVGTDYKSDGDCIETVNSSYLAGKEVTGKCTLAKAKTLRDSKTKPEEVGGGLALGSLIGIIVGSLVLVVVVVLVVVCMMRRKNHQGQHNKIGKESVQLTDADANDKENVGPDGLPKQLPIDLVKAQNN